MTNKYQTVSARFDCVFQPPSTSKSSVIDRAILPIVSSCIEGVNVNLLSIGSEKVREKDGLFEFSQRDNFASAVFQTLVEELETKRSRYGAIKTRLDNKSSLSGSRVTGSESVVALRYTLRISLAEISDGLITVGSQLQNTNFLLRTH